MSDRPEVVLVDAAHRVPYYDRALADALARAGWAPTLAVGPAIYYDVPRRMAGGAQVEERFGRLLAAMARVRLDPARFPSLRRAARAAGYPLELAALTRRLVADPPAALHIVFSPAPRMDAAWLAFLRRRGIRTVVTVHNVLPHEGGPGQRLRWRPLYTSADRLVVHSRSAARALAALLSDGGAPSRPDLIRVVPMPADPNPRALQHARAAARERLGLPSIGVPLALFFGQLRPYKGVDVLLEAWPQVRFRVPGARLAIAGAAPGGVPQGVGAALERAGDGVELRLGHASTEEAADFIAAADVVMLPYRHCDGSAVLASARAAGRAVVASEVGALAEGAAEGGCVGVPPGDPRALAAAVVEVLSDSVLRERLEGEAERSAAGWTWDDAAREMVDVYTNG